MVVRRLRLVAGGVAALFLLGAAVAAAAAVLSQAPSGRTLVFTAHPAKRGGVAMMRLRSHGYRLELRLSPNRSTAANRAAVVLSRGGTPVAGARIRVTFTMLDMAMPGRRFVLHVAAAGRYAGATPPLGMNGRWGVRVDVTPRSGHSFSVGVVDRLSA